VRIVSKNTKTAALSNLLARCQIAYVQHLGKCYQTLLKHKITTTIALYMFSVAILNIEIKNISFKCIFSNKL
jgi:hypothetical protein